MMHSRGESRAPEALIRRTAPGDVWSVTTAAAPDRRLCIAEAAAGLEAGRPEEAVCLVAEHPAARLVAGYPATARPMATPQAFAVPDRTADHPEVARPETAGPTSDLQTG